MTPDGWQTLGIAAGGAAGLLWTSGRRIVVGHAASWPGILAWHPWPETWWKVAERTPPKGVLLVLETESRSRVIGVWGPEYRRWAYLPKAPECR